MARFVRLYRLSLYEGWRGVLVVGLPVPAEIRTELTIHEAGCQPPRAGTAIHLGGIAYACTVVKDAGIHVTAIVTCGDGAAVKIPDYSGHRLSLLMRCVGPACNDGSSCYAIYVHQGTAVSIDVPLERRGFYPAVIQLDYAAKTAA